MSFIIGSECNDRLSCDSEEKECLFASGEKCGKTGREHYSNDCVKGYFCLPPAENPDSSVLYCRKTEITIM